MIGMNLWFTSIVPFLMMPSDDDACVRVQLKAFYTLKLST